MEMYREGRTAIKADMAKRKAKAAEEKAAMKADMAKRKAKAAEEKAAMKAGMAKRKAEVAEERAAIKAGMAKKKAEVAEERAAIKADMAEKKAEAAEKRAAMQADMAKEGMASEREMGETQDNMGSGVAEDIEVQHTEYGEGIEEGYPEKSDTTQGATVEDLGEVSKAKEWRIRMQKNLKERFDELSVIEVYTNAMFQRDMEIIRSMENMNFVDATMRAVLEQYESMVVMKREQTYRQEQRMELMKKQVQDILDSSNRNQISDYEYSKEMFMYDGEMLNNLREVYAIHDDIIAMIDEQEKALAKKRAKAYKYEQEQKIHVKREQPETRDYLGEAAIELGLSQELADRLIKGSAQIGNVEFYGMIKDVFLVNDSENDREVKQGFRKMALKFHPDTNQDNKERQGVMDVKMKLINALYAEYKSRR